MSGGMRIDDIRELPRPLREQVVEKVVAHVMSAAPVAARPAVKVTVKRLCFPSRAAVVRYYALKDAAREGVISHLQFEWYDGYIRSFRYIIEWAGERIPTGIPFNDLEYWYALGKGYMVVEDIRKEVKENVHS